DDGVAVGDSSLVGREQTADRRSDVQRSKEVITDPNPHSHLANTAARLSKRHQGRALICDQAIERSCRLPEIAVIRVGHSTSAILGASGADGSDRASVGNWKRPEQLRVHDAKDGTDRKSVM